MSGLLLGGLDNVTNVKIVNKNSLLIADTYSNNKSTSQIDIKIGANKENSVYELFIKVEGTSTAANAGLYMKVLDSSDYQFGNFKRRHCINGTYSVPGGNETDAKIIQFNNDQSGQTVYGIYKITFTTKPSTGVAGYQNIRFDTRGNSNCGPSKFTTDFSSNINVSVSGLTGYIKALRFKRNNLSYCKMTYSLTKIF